MQQKKEKTIEQVKTLTKKFFNLHWNWDKINDVAPDDDCWKTGWKLYQGLKGSIPNGDRQGCYALVQDKEVIYIGLGASRGWGKYPEHGIGARIGHVVKWDRSIKTDMANRVSKPRKKWEGITEIYTLGLPSGYGYLACSLEAYLISKIDPERNRVKTSLKSK